MISQTNFPQTSTDNLENTWASKIRQKFEPVRFPVLVLLHAVIFVLIYFCALFLRFDKFLPDNPRHLNVLPLVVLVKIGCFWGFKTFHGWWRHVTFTDLVVLAKSTCCAIAIFWLLDYLVLSEQISRGVILIDGAFTIAVMSALRGVWRSWDERLIFRSNDRNAKRALLIGDDIATAKLASMINNRQSIDAHIVGLVSAKKENTPRKFNRLRIIGAVSELKTLCRDQRIDTVYAPAGTLPAKEIRSLIDSVRDLNVQVNIVPALSSLLEGGTKIPIREVCFEDLLRRDPVNLDQNLIHQMLKGKKILVTGCSSFLNCSRLQSVDAINSQNLISPSRSASLELGANWSIL